MASPFCMALNAFVSRSVANYVNSFKVGGEWREYELEDHTRHGRVPDSSMMLNTLVRVAVEKMVALEEFRCA